MIGRFLLFLAVLLGLAAVILLGLPPTIRFAEYLLAGSEKSYVLIPLLAALAMAAYVIYLLARNQRRRLFLVFIVSFPLISTLHRRMELSVAGMEFYIETALVLLLTLYLWHYRRIRTYGLSAVNWMMALGFIAASMSLLQNQVLNPDTLWYLVQEYLLPFGCFFMALSMVRDRWDMEKMLRALMASLVVFALLSLAWVFVLDQTIGLDVGEVLLAQTRISGGVRRLLVGAGFVNSEVGNRVFMLLLPVAAVMIRGRALSRENLLPYAIILISSYFIVATEHRAALLGAVIVFLLFLVFGRTRNVKTWMKVLILALVVFFLHDKILEYLNRRILLEESIMMDYSAQKRLIMWRFAMNLFHANPLFGIGPLQYLPAAMNTPAQAITPHNYYMTLLAEQGLLGLMCYLGMVGAIFARGLRNLRRLASPQLRRLNFGLMAGVFYYQFALFFGGGRLTHNNVIYIHCLFWLVAALLWILPRMQQQEDVEESAEIRALSASWPDDEHAASAPPVPVPAAGSHRP